MAIHVCTCSCDNSHYGKRPEKARQQDRTISAEPITAAFSLTFFFKVIKLCQPAHNLKFQAVLYCPSSVDFCANGVSVSVWPTLAKGSPSSLKNATGGNQRPGVSSPKLAYAWVRRKVAASRFQSLDIEMSTAEEANKKYHAHEVPLR